MVSLKMIRGTGRMTALFACIFALCALILAEKARGAPKSPLTKGDLGGCSERSQLCTSVPLDALGMPYTTPWPPFLRGNLGTNPPFKIPPNPPLLKRGTEPPASEFRDEALKLADHLSEQGSYDNAITEYRRFVFFNPQSDYLGYAQYRMGLAYRAMRSWQKAVDAFRVSISAAKDSETADERRIVLATTLIASGNYSLARLELLKTSDYSEDQLLHLRSLYFDGIASLYMLDWEASAVAFSRFYSEYDGGRMMERTKEIDSILLEARQSYRSAGLARSLSTILPGLGQTYAGNWRDGLNALALNGVFAGFIANAIYRRDYGNAALISYISLRYYMGNRYRAEVGVRGYNESVDRRSALRILKLARLDEPK